jgi:hypothetical protein
LFIVEVACFAIIWKRYIVCSAIIFSVPILEKLQLREEKKLIFRFDIRKQIKQFVEIKPKVEDICHASQRGSSSQPRGPLENASAPPLEDICVGLHTFPR